jgi:hypothetical protein
MRFIHLPVALTMIGLILAGSDKYSPQEPISSNIPKAAIGSLSKGQPIHSVTGSGRVEEEGFAFWTMVAAHQNADGTVWGNVVANIDARVFGLGHIKISGKSTCLTMDGNSAWIGSSIDQSTNTDIFPIGASVITIVRDLGGEGQDIMHTESGDFFPPGTTCTDKPALPETLVSQGNRNVR